MGIDIIGSKEKAVAIVEIPENKRESEIVEKIFRNNKHVKSILKKIPGRIGDYRLWNLEIIAGDENTEVIHKEYNYLLKLDPKKVYFSPREAKERQRIASSVNENETVMLFFAGIGSYAVAIAKRQPKVKKIIAIEINPEAFHYMHENIRINKISHLVEPILGDVRIEAKKFFNLCDRVIMPLPLEAEKFLDLAESCIKGKGIIHFYSIDNENFDSSLEKIGKFLKNYKIINKEIVLPYSPGKFKVCLDVEINRFKNFKG